MVWQFLFSLHPPLQWIEVGSVSLQILLLRLSPINLPALARLWRILMHALVSLLET